MAIALRRLYFYATTPQSELTLRTIVTEADQNLDIYGTAPGEGLIAVGDDVYLDLA